MGNIVHSPLSKYLIDNNITSAKGLNLEELSFKFNTNKAAIYTRISLLNKSRAKKPINKTVDTHSTHEEFTVDKSDKNSSILSKSFKIKTVDELVKVAKIDLTKEKIVRSIVNKWEVASRAGDGFISEELWQIKLFLEPITASEVRISKEELVNELLREIPIKKVIKPKKEVNSGYNYLMSIPDLHLGKFGITEETNIETNSLISKNRYWEGFRQLLHKGTKYQSKIDEITMVIGNDFMNFEGLSKATTKGTPQDSDLRWTTMFREAKDLMIQCIQYAQGFSKSIKVIMVPGNHDEQSNFYLGVVLSAFFNYDKSVSIDDRGNARKYHTWGKCLFGFTHGDCEKQKDLPSIMATESKEAWAATEYREWLIGHFHKGAQMSWNSQDEFNGVQIITLPSLSGTDFWHHKHGYVGNIPRAVGRLYHKDNGLEAIFNWNSNI